MRPDFHILAISENLIEVLFGVVFFLIWIASAAMSQLNKQREKVRRERVRRELESGRTPPPPMTQQAPYPQQYPQPQQYPPPQQRPRPIQSRPTVTRPAPQRAPARRPAPPPTKRPVMRPAPVPIEAMLPPLPTAPPIPATPIQPVAAARRPTSATALALNAWLNPGTLRKQFILTEILQPPLALRDPEASRII